MANDLINKDSIRDWIRKVNAIIDLKTVDGSFPLEVDEEVISPITINVGDGRVRVGTDIDYIPAITLTLDPASTYRIGINTLTSQTASFKLGTVPQTGFVPIWEVQTNDVSVSKALDLRTWAQDSDSGTDSSFFELRNDIDAAADQAAENAQRILNEAAETAAEIQELTTKASTNAQDIIAEAQARESAISTEISARQSADAALTTRIDTVVATAGDNAAAIVTEQTTRADGDTALSQEIDSLAVTVSDNTSLIQTEQTARIDDDDALAQDILTLSVTVGDNAAAIVTEQTARADDDSALALDISTIGVQADDNSAAIVTEQTARADTDSALAQDITNLSALVGDNAAAIETEQTVRADNDSALSEDITTITSTVDGNTATISTQQASIDGIEAQYVLTVEANGVVSGLKLAAGPEGSEFLIQADRFAIIDPNGIPGQDNIVPFKVSGGVVTIPELEVVNGNIDNVSADKIITGTLASTESIITEGTIEAVDDIGTPVVRTGIGNQTFNTKNYLMWSYNGTDVTFGVDELGNVEMTGTFTIASGSSGVSNLSDAGTLATKNNVGNNEITFNYAASTSKGGNALDTDNVGGQSATTVRDGAQNGALYGGTGINVVNPLYSDFESSIQPSFSTTTGVTPSLTSIRSKIGSSSLNLVVDSTDSFIYMGATPTDYNLVIDPNQKWLVSMYVYIENVNSPAGNMQIYLRTNDSNSFFSFTETGIPIGQWVRVRGVIDLSGDPSNKATMRIDPDINTASGNTTMQIDGIMMEALVGTNTSPSPYSIPSTSNWNNLTEIPERFFDAVSANIQANGGLVVTNQALGFYSSIDTDFRTFIANDGTFRFGNPADNFISFNGTQLVIDTPELSVDGSGNATFGGSLSAATGTFGDDSTDQFISYDGTTLTLGSGVTIGDNTDRTITVGAAGDYTTLNLALEALSRTVPAYKAGGFTATVLVDDGHTESSGIDIVGVSLGFVTIKGQSETSFVTFSSSDYAIRVRDGATGPKIDIGIVASTSMSEAAIWVDNAGYLEFIVRPSTADRIVIDPGGSTYGIRVENSSRCFAERVESKSAVYPVYANKGSSINFYRGLVRSYYVALFATNSSDIFAVQSDIIDCNGLAGSRIAQALTDSKINLYLSDISGATIPEQGVFAQRSSKIIASSCSLGSGTDYRLNARFGSQIEAINATGASSDTEEIFISFGSTVQTSSTTGLTTIAGGLSFNTLYEEGIAFQT